ncbi:bacillithiol biosynthesis BshC, partial [Candidatus Aerophobetes bacterium]
DRGLRDSSQASLRKALRAVDTLEDKAAARLKKQNTLMQTQIDKAARNIFPLKDLQERKLNVLEYLIKFGQDFLKVIYDEFSTSDYGKHKVISFQ